MTEKQIDEISKFNYEIGRMMGEIETKFKYNLEIDIDLYSRRVSILKNQFPSFNDERAIAKILSALKSLKGDEN